VNARRKFLLISMSNFVDNGVTTKDTISSNDQVKIGYQNNVLIHKPWCS